MRKKALHVTLNIREPSTVGLTVAERVQLDRLVPSGGGYVAERRGSLLQPGVTTVALEPGRYFFKTLSDAHLKVVCGGIDIASHNDGKDVPPEPRIVSTKGDEPPGKLPALTVEN
ncbi:MAG TPA: hypothetical protein VHW23_09035 [Kofleriaceae bacterium]|jgi:hypothetical protein|nr:hypothetical protein [Kofleriaceae bacterium]